MNGLQVPDCDEFLRGVDAYERNEQRGNDYFQALNHIQQNWGNPEEMAQGIELLLKSWHQGFYRFGNFDRNLLLECIKRNLELINKFRDRDIIMSDLNKLTSPFVIANEVRQSQGIATSLRSSQ